jgi:MFS family permease
LNQQVEQKKPRLYYGYILLAFAFLINLVLGGTLYTFSVFFEALESDFGWTRAATSGAFSLYMFLHGFLYIITGKLNDRFGSRIVMTACGLLTGLGYLLMSLTGTIWHIYLFYGVIIAIGMSGSYVPLTSTVTRWFASFKTRGLMVGISVAGIGVGTMIMPPLANWLISSYDWATSYVVIGTIILVLVIPAAQFLKPTPVEGEQLPSNQDRMKIENPVSNIKGLSLQQALRTRQFWLLCTAYLGFGFFLQAIMVHIVLHAVDLKISESTAANIFIAIGALSVVGKIMAGNFIDRIGNRLVMAGCFALVAADMAWLLIAREEWMIFLFAAVFGFSYGGLVSAQSPVVADLFGMKSHGVILGVVIFIVTIGGTVGPVVAGGIYDANNTYYPAFIICGVLSLLGVILSLLLKPISKGGAK